MLHHVTLEVAPEEMGRAAEFWGIVGFREVSPPADLAPRFAWFEKEGTQVHLMRTAAATVPAFGHAAVIAPDLERTVERLRAAGFEVSPKRERWGAARAQAVAPGGHLVELMAAPPPPAGEDDPEAAAQ